MWWLFLPEGKRYGSEIDGLLQAALIGEPKATWAHGEDWTQLHLWTVSQNIAWTPLCGSEPDTRVLTGTLVWKPCPVCEALYDAALAAWDERGQWAE